LEEEEVGKRLEEGKRRSSLSYAPILDSPLGSPFYEQL
jgi:hypothetical protein